MIFIGMAHRGRLNVLAHVMEKPYAQILAEFRDPKGRFTPWDELGWTGDVKYHKGASGTLRGGEVTRLVICMPPNPSHVEHVDPVVEGMARAADSGVDRPGQPRFFPRASLPVLIHGDASFPGQGIVAETLNLSRLPGYRTAGTIHIIANNQLGFTTVEEESRSTLYASDLAKGFKIPIMHVNADDPIACMEAARTAIAYRAQFQSDFFIDLIGYRRYGHNEGDEPGFTQPQMYQAIREHPTVRQIWAKSLVEQNLIDPNLPEELVRRGMERCRRRAPETGECWQNHGPPPLRRTGGWRQLSAASPAGSTGPLLAAEGLHPIQSWNAESSAAGLRPDRPAWIERPAFSRPSWKIAFYPFDWKILRGLQPPRRTTWRPECHNPHQSSSGRASLKS
jgi:2-oxoglutarate dehydrogenase E1 component